MERASNANAKARAKGRRDLGECYGRERPKLYTEPPSASLEGGCPSPTPPHHPLLHHLVSCDGDQRRGWISASWAARTNLAAVVTGRARLSTRGPRDTRGERVEGKAITDFGVISAITACKSTVVNRPFILPAAVIDSFQLTSTPRLAWYRITSYEIRK